MNGNIDILLVIPHQPRTAEILSISSGITPPHGIGYIASYLLKNNFSVKILDNSIEHLNGHEFQNYIKENKPLCVGFSVCSSSYNNAIYLASLVKRVNPKISVVMGGIHPSSLPREVLSNEEVDIVVKGEGEETTSQLLKSLKDKKNLENIEGIVFKSGKEIMEMPDRPLIGDLDKIPFPDYSLLPMNKYTLPASRRLTNKKVGSVITSRGCVYKCTFCSHNNIFHGKVRLRSPENVISEIEYLVKNFDIGELIFWDDSFLLDKGRAIKICQYMRKKKLNIKWSCSSRVDHISEEIIKELYSSGCRLILFGVESGSQGVLDALQKKTTISQIKNAVSVCKRNNILSFCSFILGTPYDTKETLEKTLRFAVNLNPDFAIFCIFTPLPGSSLFNEYLSKGQIKVKNINWDRFINLLSTDPPLFTTGEFSKKFLINFQKKAFREFYLRLSYFTQRLKKIKSWAQLYQLWLGFKTIIKIEIHKFTFADP